MQEDQTPKVIFSSWFWRVLVKMARKYWRQEQVAKIIVRIRKQEQDQNPEMSIAFTAMPQ